MRCLTTGRQERIVAKDRTGAIELPHKEEFEMSGKAPIDFWFSAGSTYSFLSVMRLPQVSRETGIPFRWRPFNVRSIMKAMNNSFLAGKPEKYAYMWRDIGRRAAAYGIVANVPVPHPIQQIELANRIGVLAADEGWCEAYAQATFRRWFGQGQEPGSEPNVSDSLREIGQDPARVLDWADTPGADAALTAATEEARSLGIFGSPNFVVGGTELFWGDDRLVDAISWYRHGSLLAG
jgi:2-hydroxychromene-2-carboxylate isomerase